MKKDNESLLQQIVPENFYKEFCLNGGIFKDQFESINRSCKIDSLIKQLDIKNPVIKKNCISCVQQMIQSEITFSRIDYHDFIQKLNIILGEKTIKYKFSLLLKNMSNSINYHKTIIFKEGTKFLDENLLNLNLEITDHIFSIEANFDGYNFFPIGNIDHAFGQLCRTIASFFLIKDILRIKREEKATLEIDIANSLQLEHYTSLNFSLNNDFFKSIKLRDIDTDFIDISLKFFQTMIEKNEQKHLINSLINYFLYVDADNYSAGCVLYLVTAFESLLIKPENDKFKSSTRNIIIGYFISECFDDYQKIITALNSLVQLRNELIHGGGHYNFATACKIYNDGEFIFRRTILKIIKWYNLEL
ncbi:hypothetical protein Lsan_1008 [Legionella santicrucis]|uniref:Apea-like HEPN domain-containing protein n=1 Tax=Legionella santicrucis TaxID=45074 RepID=A0A0W0Z375_9GAMM|nr:hypothetical protein [Legionella santicrucis]KTD63575.1 hypothetical protein Lsan_1008 [Legionella santicrucis]